MMVDARNEDFELAEIDGEPVIFTNARIDRDTVPLIYTAMMSESQRALVAIQLRWRRLLL